MSKSSKVDWAVDERKLQPAYDDIQAGKYKSADSIVSRHLKKAPKSQPALALKLYLQEKLGQGAGAVLETYESIRKTGDYTNRTLFWLSLCLRNIQRPDLVLEIYQSAWISRPDDLEIGEHVFLNAAAAMDRDAMISSSQRMWKSIKAPAWARIAAWSEWATTVPIAPTVDIPFPPPSSDGSLKAALLPLISTKKAVDTPEFLWLHLQIYMAAKMEDHALNLVRKDTDWPTSILNVNGNGQMEVNGVDGESKVVDGEAGVSRGYWRIRLVEEIHRRRYGKIPTLGEHKASKKEEFQNKTKISEGSEVLWEREWTWSADCISKDTISSRNYLFYRHLIHSAIHTAHSTPDIIDITREYLQGMDELIGKKERSPKLAILDLDILLRQNGLENHCLKKEERKALVEGYWEIWSNRCCVIEDLEELVDVELDDIVEEAVKGHDDIDSWIRLRHGEIWLSKRRNQDSCVTEKDVVRIWKRYTEGLEYGKSLPKTDVQPADELGFLAVEYLVDLYSRDNSNKYLIQAITCLRIISANSPSQKKAHFLLVRLYRLIGAPSLAVTSMNKIDPSEIHLDAVSHIYTERGIDALLGGSEEEYTKLAEKALAMYKRSGVDLPEYIKQAFQYESYSKLHGIKKLHQQLQNSLSRYTLTIDRIRLSFLTTGNIQVPWKLRVLGELEDNRNWELVPCISGVDFRRLTELGKGVEEGYVKVWAGVLGGLVDWLEGDEVGEKDLDIDEKQFSSLLPAEKSMLQAVQSILREAIQASSIPAVDEATGSSNEDLSNILDSNYQFCLAEGRTSRWEQLYRVVLYIELSRIIDTIIKRLSELTKSKKGKKAPQGLTDLLNELRRVKEQNTKTKIGEIKAFLEGLIKGDEALDVAELRKGDWLDSDTFSKTSKEIVEARKLAVENLMKFLLQK